MTKLFVDANVLIDISVTNRPSSEDSLIFYQFLLENNSKFELFTSCDLLTTIYYILRRQLNKADALNKIKIINRIFFVIEFGNKEIDEAIELMERNKKYTDLEDTIQYVMARKEKCDYIITNDKAFTSGDVPVLSSGEALVEFIQR